MPTEPTGGDTRAILAAGLDPAKPEDAIAATVARVSNWGRWGADDVLGTLNLLDDAKRVEGAALVRRGAAFSLSQPFDMDGPAARLAAAHQPRAHDARHRPRGPRRRVPARARRRRRRHRHAAAVLDPVGRARAHLRPRPRLERSRRRRRRHQRGRPRHRHRDRRRPPRRARGAARRRPRPRPPTARRRRAARRLRDHRRAPRADASPPRASRSGAATSSACAPASTPRTRREGWGTYAGGPAPGPVVHHRRLAARHRDRRDRHRHLGLRGPAQRVRRRLPAPAPDRHPAPRPVHRRDVGPRGARRRLRRAADRVYDFWLTAAPLRITGAVGSPSTRSPSSRRTPMAAVRSVLVVGGGAAGCATAILLARAGVAVDLVEIKPDVTAVGSGITLQGNALRVLARPRRVRRRRSPSGTRFDDLGLRAPDGTVLVEMPDASTGGADLPGHRRHARRARPGALLLARAQEVGAKLRFGTTVEPPRPGRRRRRRRVLRRLHRALRPGRRRRRRPLARPRSLIGIEVDVAPSGWASGGCSRRARPASSAPTSTTAAPATSRATAPPARTASTPTSSRTPRTAPGSRPRSSSRSCAGSPRSTTGRGTTSAS